MTYELIDYDVWGNEEEGFWVNQAFHTGQHVEVPEGATDAQLVAILVDEGHLKSNVTAADIEVDGEEGHHFYFNDAKNGEPLFELQAGE